ncbi:MAG: ABC transporter permease [Caldilineaceae bacterium]|jgi:ribose/xylose/arabinose/galactoside ABC-type transport system permease subunit
MSAQTVDPLIKPTLLFAKLRRHAPILVVYTLLLLMVIGASLTADRFLTERNIFNVLRQAAFLGVAAIGQTLVILTGGIDLSIGSLVKLSLLVSALVMDGQPALTLPAVAVTLLLGASIGAIHAFLITRLQVAPFIVTLGSYSILRGLSFAIATKPVGGASPGMLALYDLKVGPVPVLVIGFALLLVAVVIMLRRTRFGRYIYAIGSNEQGARLAGLPVDRVKYGVYILCSMLTALTGLLYLSRMGIGDPSVGDGLELQTITAVILGGTSLFGGRGGVIGTLGGVLLLGLTSNLLVVLRVNQWIQELIEGAIIVGAVALYKQKGR